MADYMNDLVRAWGGEQRVVDCVLVDQHGGNERSLATLLTNLEVDRDRYKEDFEEMIRRHRDQTRALQSLVDEIKEVLASGMSWNMNDWDDLVNAFSRFDGLDLDQPRREWRAEVEVTVLMSLSGDAPGDIDENQIADLVGQHFGKGDIDIDLMFTDGHDDVDANDQNILGYDLSVDVEFD